MGIGFRKFIPQKAINLGRHLPTATLANLKYGFPSRGLKIIGVTGTDGKTTTVNMIYQILCQAGLEASMVSTINASVGGKDYDTGFHVTSPDPYLLQKLISEAKKRRSEYLVLEVTSHALDQYRFLGVPFLVGVITNVTHEHLDYHKSFKNYLNTKAKLIKNVKVAILNYDDPNFKFLTKKTKGQAISFGLSKEADFNPSNFKLNLKIPGQYNLYNALGAAATAQAIGIDPTVIKKALENFTPLTGRMEEIKNSRGIHIFVDFAHTPNGLKQALTALREKFGKRQIIALIGAEGYRDIGKRAMMGEVATKLADKVIITSVDPRGLINQINNQILEGVNKAKGVLGKDVFVENDRDLAISTAINQLAKKGDVVGIFGKGHEKSMNWDGKKELPWSDFDSVKRALNGQKT